MDDVKIFYINGLKKIIFRREGNDYICFDPIDLEYYKMNELGGIILYFISEKNSFDNIASLLSEWLEDDIDNVKQLLIDFLTNCPIRKLIYVNLIELGVPIYA